ncbi:MAG: hypothetical protein WEG36_15325 [Gemmatimonadota bacterium]
MRARADTVADRTTGEPSAAARADRAGADEEAQEALEREVVGGWKSFETNGGMIYEQGVITATGRK